MVNILGIQIIGIFFALFMLYLTFLHNKRKEFTSKEGLFWIVLWIVFIFITVFPNAMDFLVKDLLELKRPLDFYIILGFMFLIGSVFYTYTIVRKNQRRIEEVVRNSALKNVEENKEGKEENRETKNDSISQTAQHS